MEAKIVEKEINILRLLNEVIALLDAGQDIIWKDNLSHELESYKTLFNVSNDTDVLIEKVSILRNIHNYYGGMNSLNDVYIRSKAGIDDSKQLNSTFGQKISELYNIVGELRNEIQSLLKK